MKWIYILTVVSVFAIGIICLKEFRFCKCPHRDPDISKLERIAHVLNEYNSQSNHYPESLDAILSLPAAKQFLVYSNGAPLQDSWGHKFVYELKGSNFTLLSIGPDGLIGTSDDIRKSSKTEQ